MNDHELAAAIARQAGELLIDVRAAAEAEGVDEKTTRSRGDLTSNDLILAELARERPDDAVLSEESKDDPVRLTRRARVDRRPARRHARVRGVRPHRLGRARRARERGHTDRRGRRAPRARRGALDRVAARRSPRPHGGAPRLVVSRTRPPKITAYLAEVLGAELVPMGSAGAKTMAVVRGEADVYAHGGGQYEWDSAAPVGVAAAAGLTCSRLDGSPLVYNQPDPYLPDLLVCRPELAAAGARRHRIGAARVERIGKVAKARPLHCIFPAGRSAAWLARSVRDAEVPGSNPGAPTNISAGQTPSRRRDGDRAHAPTRDSPAGPGETEP